MQDFEFTIENNKLYMLQTMNDKHIGLSADKIAVEMVNEGLIDKETAIKLIPADSISSLLVPVQYQAIYFSPKKDEERYDNGEKVILTHSETSSEDIRGMLG